MSSQNFFKTSTSGAFRPSSAFELINLALERQEAAFGDEFAMVTPGNFSQWTEIKLSG